MNLKRMIASGLAVLTLIMPLAACRGRGEAPEHSLTVPKEIDKTPVEIPEGTDYASLAAEHLDGVGEAPAADFTYITANGVARITGYTGQASAVRVPSALGGMPVTSIADGVFEGHGEIVSLILPETLAYLGEGILKNCTSLQYLECALMGADFESAQYLGYLFGAQTHEDNPRDIPPALKLVRVSGTQTELAPYVFFDCNDLCAVILPESMQTVGKFAFYNCASMECVLGLERLVTVAEYAFADCVAFTELRFGASLTSMGYAALLGCDGLVSVSLPFAGGTATEHTYLGYVFGAESVDFSKGYYPPRLSRVELLEGCESLGNYAFFECESLKEVLLPEGMTTVGARAFYRCEALWSITLPDSLKTVREAAFHGCTALGEITFGTGLTKIGANAFYQCVSLASVTLPASLKSLPSSCFADCISLKTVRLGGVSSVGAQAFRNCTALKSVKASGKVTFGEGNDYAEKVLK
ncbi:MAG: leucine-rich repeat protein [Clostridia bacterium]|nr:leucine-rich repeat protein [Clostridia bacterium]